MKILIVAPHIDDEIIGCWSLFCNPENEIYVVWLYELHDDRKAEAKCLSSSDLIKAKIKQLEFGDTSVEPIVQALKTSKKPYQVYVPSRKDSHYDHKWANSQYRKYATHFYSVDMVGGIYKSNHYAQSKKTMLDAAYPSQKQLWDCNAKYYLFESIREKDYDRYCTFTYEGLKITTLEEYTLKCCKFLSEKRLCNYSFKLNDYMDLILQQCPTGKVTVECDSVVLTSEG